MNYFLRCLVECGWHIQYFVAAVKFVVKWSENNCYNFKGKDYLKPTRLNYGLQGHCVLLGNALGLNKKLC